MLYYSRCLTCRWTEPLFHPVFVIVPLHPTASSFSSVSDCSNMQEIMLRVILIGALEDGNACLI